MSILTADDHMPHSITHKHKTRDRKKDPRCSHTSTRSCTPNQLLSTMPPPRATIALLLASACQVSCLVLQAAGARPRAVVASRCSPAMSMEEGDAGVGERGGR